MFVHTIMLKYYGRAFTISSTILRLILLSFGAVTFFVAPKGQEVAHTLLIMLSCDLRLINTKPNLLPLSKADFIHRFYME